MSDLSDRLDACQAAIDDCVDNLHRLGERVEGLRADDKISRRLERLKQRRVGRADAGQYPNKLEIELSNWENIGALLEFLKYVRVAANGGHSFGIGADESADAPHKELGSQKFGAVVFVDGDGNDHIGKIMLNGQEVK